MAHGRPPRGFGHLPRNNSYRPPRGGHNHNSSNAGSAIGSVIALGITALAAGNAIKKARDENPALRPKPQKKTVNKTTQMYLPQILRDFPAFHNPQAESDIKSVLREYIYSVHSGKTSLNCDSIDRDAFDRIIPKDDGNVTDVVFHQIEIQNYQRSNHYATIYYQVAFGYQLNDFQQEVLYEIRYSLQADNNNTVGMLKCPNCGAPIDTMGMATHCKYCDTQISKDAMSSWVVSDIREIK